MKSAVAVLLFLSASINADVYIQNARGSNNRLDERGRERANANRMFNSQNNNRGGYNVGHLTYYNGEIVPISWTNQHSAGKYQLKETELILQYTCGSLMRDGTTTNRIPDTPTECDGFNCDTDVEYGRHESWSDYQYCKATSRNKGLFTANQNLNGRNAATYTRQSPAGTRYGYECSEERDYYPYWRPSVWRDMAIYTNTPERCDAYEKESFNVKDRWACVYTDDYWDDYLYGYVMQSHGMLPLTQEDCDNCENGWYWNMAMNKTMCMYEYKVFDSWGIDEPYCAQTRTTRTNHHGIPGDKSYWTHYWQVPDEMLEMDGHEQCCVIRLRYNITTNDYQAWEDEYSINAGLDYKNNSQVTSPDPDDDPAWVKIWENFGLEYEDIMDSFMYPDADSDMQYTSRGYVFRNNPRVDPFGHDPVPYMMNGMNYESRILLQLAINTNQFGRTFQDRTHCFSVKDRKDAGIPNSDNKDITLVTVQGKRGNIVQVYPATEYFFIPEPAVIYQDTYIHFCWTGSNTNPHNNDGQGSEGSDRSNICPLTQQQWDKYDKKDPLGVYGDVGGYWEDRQDGAVGDPGNSYPDWLVEPEYGFPTYYKYAPKRDLPRYSSDYESDGKVTNDYDLKEYPYNDPYVQWWYAQRGVESQMANLDLGVLGALCTTRKVDNLYNNDLGLFDYGNMEELDDAGTTFCIEPVKASQTGLWHFLCTRNNNFSNRSQKGSLWVTDSKTLLISATNEGTSSGYEAGQAKAVVLPGAVEDGESLDFSVTTWANQGEESTIVEVSGYDGSEFNGESMTDGAWLELWIPYTGKSLSYPQAWYREDKGDKWKEHSEASVEYSTETTYGVVNIVDGGYYTISNEPDILACVAVVLGVGLFVGAFVLLVKDRCRPTKV